MTLVLLFGGYVVFDRMCEADPVCRAHDVSGDPSMQIPSLPVYPFHSIAEDHLEVAGDGDAGVRQDVDWTVEGTMHGGHARVRHAFAVRRVSAHAKFGRKPMSKHVDISRLYSMH
ncbi:hypothetical protein [Burkholderia guangdongensis]|uniref:hypothetical protein n=1 Tax=Burkholderia guangdongensis TaxID=1792500 RepID=UPI0015CAFCAF|nr:hypothetical protein [Burkholderia guangdongensis]